MRDEYPPSLNGASPYSANGHLEVTPPSPVARCYVNVQRLPSPAIVASVFNHYSPSPFSGTASQVHDGTEPEVTCHEISVGDESKLNDVGRGRARTAKPVIYREVHHEVEHAATLSRAHSCHESHSTQQGASFLQRRATIDGYPQREPHVAPAKSKQMVSEYLSSVCR